MGLGSKPCGSAVRGCEYVAVEREVEIGDTLRAVQLENLRAPGRAHGTAPVGIVDQRQDPRRHGVVVVDRHDEFMEKDQALVVFNEAHKYIESPDLVAGLVKVAREIRHKGTSIMVASHDPPSVPVQLIELSSKIILHKVNSPAWLKYIHKANAALGGLTPEKRAHLRPGEAFVWSRKATDDAFSKGAVKVRCRLRATQHGGATKTAVRD